MLLGLCRAATPRDEPLWAIPGKERMGSQQIGAGDRGGSRFAVLK